MLVTQTLTRTCSYQISNHSLLRKYVYLYSLLIHVASHTSAHTSTPTHPRKPTPHRSGCPPIDFHFSPDHARKGERLVRPIGSRTFSDDDNSIFDRGQGFLGRGDVTISKCRELYGEKGNVAVAFLLTVY